MNAKRNYWHDLKCKPGSDREQLRSAYRAIARATHSDANQGSEEHREAFEAAVEAWKVLSDDQKRTSWLFERHLWLKACGAIECKGCGSAVKIRQGQGQQRCPICKTDVHGFGTSAPQTESEPAERSEQTSAKFYRPFADSGRRIGTRLVDATEEEAERLGQELLAESGKLLGQLIVMGFTAARRKLRGQ